MYVCMCVCVLIYIYKCIHIYIYIYVPCNYGKISSYNILYYCASQHRPKSSPRPLGLPRQFNQGMTTFVAPDIGTMAMFYL